MDKKLLLTSCREKLDYLTAAVEKVKLIVSKDPNSKISTDRLDCYLRATTMQQNLVQELEDVIYSEGEPSKIIVLVNKINSISSFIKEDALSLLRHPEDTKKEDFQ